MLIAFFTDTIDVWQLAVSSALFGIASGLLPAGVDRAAAGGRLPPARLQEANALMGLSRHGIDVFGPAVTRACSSRRGAATASVWVGRGELRRESRLSRSDAGGRLRPAGARASLLAEARDGLREVREAGLGCG